MGDLQQPPAEERAGPAGGKLGGISELDAAGAETPRETPGRRSLAALMMSARGTMDSGVSDLATNPDHLAGFGRDAHRDR